MWIRFLILSFIICVFSCPAGAAVQDAEKSPEPLEQILALRGDAKLVSEEYQNSFKGLRPQALREAAMILAVQAAVKYRYSQIVDRLHALAMQLDRIINFQPLLINSKVLPPVISVSNGGVVLENDKYMRAVEQTYTIISPARFVTIAPSWRDYLLREFGSVEQVNPVLLPRDKTEVSIWTESAREGWMSGIKQANHIFDLNLNRLRRDYLGIAIFRTLEKQKIVSLPQISSGKMAVKVDGKTLSINEKTFRITVPTGFQEIERWTPIIATSK